MRLRSVKIWGLFFVLCSFLKPAELYGQQTGTWSALHPWINAGVLNSVFFLDEQTGFIAEQDYLSRVLKTTDGGATWTATAKPAQYFAAQDIWFLDAERGWLVGTEGRIFYTANGGTSWEQRNNGAGSAFLRHVQFTTADSGWAAGTYYGTTTNSCILRTTDGGQNWQLQTFSDSYEIRALFLLNSRLGFAIAYKLDGNQTILYKTTDGGQIWQVYTTLDNASDGLFFSDSNTGWITQYNKILKTTDGGLIWKEKQDNNWNSLKTITFSDRNHGYAAGSTGSKGIILRTSDGGASWSLHETVRAINSLDCTGSQGVWAVGEGGTILHSTDHGSSWHNLSYFTRNNLWSLFSWTANSIWLGSATTAWQEAAIYFSSDGGSGWSLKKSNGSWRINDLQFVDASTGWAALSSGIMKTVDGGQSWTRVVPAGWNNALHGISFINRKTGWAAGGGSVSRVICKSSDGGDSWTQQTIPAGNALMDICFVSPDSGWAVGMNSAVLRTTDGGVNWTSANNGIEGDVWLNSVIFIDRLIGFAGGDGGIFITYDGGTSWQRRLAMDGIVEEICFVDERHGWAVGSGAPAAKGIAGNGAIDLYSGGIRIWQTSDGGETWTMSGTSVGDWLLSASFTDLNNGLAVGRSGTILRYTGTLPIPAAPASLYANAVNNAFIAVSWSDQSDNENGFRLFRREEPHGMWRLIAAPIANARGYEDHAVMPGIEYRYRLCAFNSTGQSALTTDIAAELVAPPLAPSALLPADDALGQPVSLTLVWSGVDAVSYHLQVAADPSFINLVVNDSTIATTRKSIGPLLHNTTYFWRVRAKNSGGVSPWSTPVRHFTTILAAPQLASPVDGAAGQPLMLTLTWRRTLGALVYHLQISGSALFEPASMVYNDSSLTDTTRIIGPLAASSNFFWRLRARNAGGISAWSAPVWRFTTKLAAPLLASPADGALAQSLTPLLSWQTVPLAARYRLQVSSDAQFTAFVVDDSTLAGTSKQIGPLESTTTYYWRLQARNVADVSAWSAPGWRFTTALAPPAAPILFAPADGVADLGSPVLLTWLAADRAASYRLQLALTAAFSPAIIDQSDILATSVQIDTLAGATTYFWRVMAVNPGGSSNWSASRHFKTALLPPQPPRLAGPADGSSNLPLSLTLSWSAGQGADFYHLQVAVKADFTQLVVNDSTLDKVRYMVSGLSPMTGYFWRVRSRNAVGRSAFSPIWSFTTSGAAWTFQQSGVETELKNVFFLDEQHGWIGGYKSVLLVTQDGGESWQKVPLPSSIYICDLHFFDLQTGICCGLGGRIIRTTDGGLTWNTIPSNSSVWLEAMKFVDAENGWIAGDNGTILRTTDGGLNWTQQNSGTANRLEDIDFVDLHNGWAVGNNNTILRTSNGGATWDIVHAAISPAWAFAVDFWDLQHGWWAGIGMGVYGTSDGGLNWTCSTEIMQNPVEQLQFLDSRIGYGVGWDGLMIKSSDGGANWQILETGTTKSLKALFFLNPATGWVVGDSGLVLCTKTGGGVVHVEDRPEAPALALPEEMVLLQNYPNPFNDNTTFAFDLPRQASVSLTIHNLRGERVAEIADGWFSPGRHTLSWRAQGLASGEYFIILRTEGQMVMRKMLYLR